jgi:hypothetical protein
MMHACFTTLVPYSPKSWSALFYFHVNGCNLSGCQAVSLCFLLYLVIFIGFTTLVPSSPKAWPALFDFGEFI